MPFRLPHNCHIFLNISRSFRCCGFLLSPLVWQLRFWRSRGLKMAYLVTGLSQFSTHLKNDMHKHTSTQTYIRAHSFMEMSHVKIVAHDVGLFNPSLRICWAVIKLNVSRLCINHSHLFFSFFFFWRNVHSSTWMVSLYLHDISCFKKKSLLLLRDCQEIVPKQVVVICGLAVPLHGKQWLRSSGILRAIK